MGKKTSLSLSPLHLYINLFLFIFILYLDTIRELHKHGADFSVKGREKGETLMHLAAVMGNINAVIELGKIMGPDIVFAVDEDGNTPLHLCAYGGKTPVVQPLGMRERERETRGRREGCERERERKKEKRK